MSKDTIYRQSTINAICNVCLDCCYEGVCKKVSAIQQLPSAQKRGHWIGEETNYSCSECHRGCWINSNYCPWCGADMRGEITNG